jgi:hypothetical protein
MAIDKLLTEEPITPAPRPIAERVCICGCGHSFIPLRRDKVYLNNQHGNYGYNHGKRKSKNKNRISAEKILLKNDNVFDKHYKSERNTKHVDRYYDILKADGFKFGYHIGKSEKDGIEYYYTYNYYYCIFFLEKIKMIKIFRR